MVITYNMDFVTVRLCKYIIITVGRLCKYFIFYNRDSVAVRLCKVILFNAGKYKVAMIASTIKRLSTK